MSDYTNLEEATFGNLTFGWTYQRENDEKFYATTLTADRTEIGTFDSRREAYDALLNWYLHHGTGLAHDNLTNSYYMLIPTTGRHWNPDVDVSKTEGTVEWLASGMGTSLSMNTVRWKVQDGEIYLSYPSSSFATMEDARGQSLAIDEAIRIAKNALRYSDNYATATKE